ncbi:hypothetical protein ACX1C1_17355 [Paenibacillus sp. strain BS8-2]
METVKLSQIVERLAPELITYLTSRELDLRIVLRDGMALLEPADVMEIVQHSICNGQRQTLLQ